MKILLTLVLFLASNAAAFDVGGSLPQGLGDGRYVQKAGDTMSGPLTVASSVTVTGNVGIGTTAPDSQLKLNGLSSQVRISRTETSTNFGADLITSGTNYYMVIGGKEYGDNRKWLMGYGFTTDNTSFPPAYIGYQQTLTGSVTKGDLVFGTRPSDSNTNPTERMRIAADGSVGISTGTPQATLDVAGGIGSYSRSMAQLLAITPLQVGVQYFCNNCSPAKMVVSTGTSAGNFADIMGGTFQ